MKAVFSADRFLYDGKVLHAGAIVRMQLGVVGRWPATTIPVFSDHIILGFDGEGDAKVSRPYAFVTNVGTTGPTVLLGTETYVLPVQHILDHFQIIENEEGRRAL